MNCPFFFFWEILPKFEIQRLTTNINMIPTPASLLGSRPINPNCSLDILPWNTVGTSNSTCLTWNVLPSLSSFFHPSLPPFPEMNSDFPSSWILYHGQGITLPLITQVRNVQLYLTPPPSSPSTADQLLNSVDVTWDKSPELVPSSISNASSPFSP